MLRRGHFDTRACDRYIRLLETVDLGEESVVDRRIVSVLWYMPLLIEWQRDRLDQDEHNALAPVLDKVTSELERILGVP